MALIPPFFIDTVIAIGKQTGTGSSIHKQWIGTGFLYGTFQNVNAEDPSKSEYKIHLVTNKHVLKNQKNIILRFNPQDGQAATDFPVALTKEDGSFVWTGHPVPNVDVAVIGLNGQMLVDAGMKFDYFKSESNILTKQNMIDEQVSEGDFIYVLGFPMGMMPSDRQHVIIRGGIIARIRDVFENRNNSFTIDSLVFPGNSGGPVIIKPESTSIQGTKAMTKAALIGIVKSYIPYTDVAVSQQTGKARITFEENSGLANVETVDKITESIAADIQRNAVV
ncbi:S1 family peptidase [Zobellia nedashkovskayae]|uniref:S1 family peptidase n=1 Tax=Zobellia nedashkovskayae TaxID=2779510 RepID=UPI00188AD7CC|nr:serine protease [Zobellia nedashkovskayae]